MKSRYSTMALIVLISIIGLGATIADDTGTYGELYIYNNTNPLTITTQDTWTLASGFTTGNTNGFTADTDGLTATETGIYRVDFMGTAHGGNNDHYNVALVKAGTLQEDCVLGRKIGLQNDVGNAGFTCIIPINAGEEIQIYVKNLDSNSDPVIVFANLNTIKIA